MNATTNVNLISRMGVSILTETGHEVLIGNASVSPGALFDAGGFLPALIGEADLKWQSTLGVSDSGITLVSDLSAPFEVAVHDVRVPFIVPGLFLLTDLLVSNIVDGKIILDPVIHRWLLQRHKWAPAVLPSPESMEA